MSANRYKPNDVLLAAHTGEERIGYFLRVGEQPSGGVDHVLLSRSELRPRQGFPLAMAGRPLETAMRGELE